MKRDLLSRKTDGRECKGSATRANSLLNVKRDLGAGDQETVRSIQAHDERISFSLLSSILLAVTPAQAYNLGKPLN